MVKYKIKIEPFDEQQNNPNGCDRFIERFEGIIELTEISDWGAKGEFGRITKVRKERRKDE